MEFSKAQSRKLLAIWKWGWGAGRLDSARKQPLEGATLLASDWSRNH